MKKLALLSAILLIQLSHATANTVYVAVDGNDTNPGTKAQPFATIQKAQTAVSPGDTVWLRGGLYHMTESQISHTERIYACVTFLDKNGAPGKYIHYWAYPGEKPVFDYSAVKPADLRVAAFYVTGSWIHLKGFEVTGVQVTIKTHTQSECFENHGSNNIYEMLGMHDGMAIGFYLLSGANNLILNCDAYRNFDYFSENGRGGNTDGFGCHPAPGGKGNVFRGCRSWFNSDDGYDVINSHEYTTFDRCWAFYNGFTPDFKSEGDGNGFKGGGYGKRPADQVPNPVPRTIVQFCLAVRNKANGFYSNHHINGSFWYNNTAYRNHINFNMLNRLPDNVTDVPGYKHVMRNNIGYKGNEEVANLDTAQCDLANNYGPLNPSLSAAGGIPTDTDFISLDESQLTAPRKADGSLPDISFLHLKPTSSFIGMGAFGSDLIYSDDFTAPPDPNTWIAEIEPKPGYTSAVYTQNGALTLDTRGGVTVWLKEPLKGNIQVEFDRKIMVDTGKNDRLSDCNLFWMATDLNNPRLFTRNGKFEAYDNLQLYYAGLGGNTNKTTRFRKYYNNGTKPVIKEYLDSPHLLQANRTYHIRILVNNGTTSLWVNNDPWFTYTDPHPLTTGCFGFRSTWSRQEIRNFRVYQLSSFD